MVFSTEVISLIIGSLLLPPLVRKVLQFITYDKKKISTNNILHLHNIMLYNFFSDFMKDSEMYTAIIEAFFKILTKSIDKQTSPGLSLRKLQFLVCKKEYEKMDPKNNSWFWNPIKKGTD